jgi:hypothetical protein
MFLAIAGVLIVLWLLGVTVFKVTKGFIHLVLLIAICAIVWHFVGGRG